MQMMDSPANLGPRLTKLASTEDVKIHIIDLEEGQDVDDYPRPWWSVIVFEGR